MVYYLIMLPEHNFKHVAHDDCNKELYASAQDHRYVSRGRSGDSAKI